MSGVFQRRLVGFMIERMGPDGVKYCTPAAEDACCNESSGGSEGSEPETSVPTVSVACCPDDPVPQTLYLTFGGGLASIGTVTMTYDAGEGDWFGGTSVSNPTFYCNLPVQFILSCTSPGVWHVSGGSAGSEDCNFEFGINVTGVTCNPLSGSVSGTASLSGPNCGECTADFTVTISESPPLT